MSAESRGSGALAGTATPTYAVEPISDPGTLAPLWQSLEENSGASLFQSWGWIGTWLRLLPDDVQPLVLTAHRDNILCGLAILCRAKRRRHGILPSNGLFLNETGIPSLDALTVEYNGILCAVEERPALTASAITFLESTIDDWDELYLSGVDDSVPEIARSAGFQVTITNEQPCDYVDLDAIRSENRPYLDRLSRNTRSQIRRALRRYGERGELSVSPAASLDEALAYFGDMKDLHQAYWNSRGQPGSFANPFFENFHRSYIEARFPFGEIEMMRASVGDEPVGFLYNILHAGHVYCYQSGFAYEADRSMKPGLVSHYLAVERNLAEGASIYDFMAGYGQHKQSLGTARRQMVWLTAAQPRLKYRLEAMLRDLRHRFRAPSSDEPA